MFRLTLLRCAAKKKVFELYCREQLLTNFSLRELSPAERRVTMAKTFKEIPAETLHDLQQRASIEESRLAALQRAAAAFRPLTPYEFFVKEQRNNPALGSAGNPREREVKLLQIFETLPDAAKEALATRAERYNAEGAKLPAAPAMPVVRAVKKKEEPATASKKKSKKKKKKALKKKKAKSSVKAKKAAETEDNDEAKKGKKKATRARGAVSPYAIFVKEQMASLHHLAPTERMRVIGERWRSLTSEERERRLAAARAKIASEAAATTPTPASDAVVDAASATTAPAPAESSTPASSPSSSSSANTATTTLPTARPVSSSPVGKQESQQALPSTTFSAFAEKKGEAQKKAPTAATPQQRPTSPSKL